MLEKNTASDDVTTLNDTMALDALAGEVNSTLESIDPTTESAVVDTTMTDISIGPLTVLPQATPLTVVGVTPVQTATTISALPDATAEVLVPLLTVSTDKPDYSPGQFATFTAANVPIGNAVKFSVAHVTAGQDGVIGTADDVLVHDINGTTQPWLVFDGGAGDLDGVTNGKIVTSWQVHQDALNQAFQLTASQVNADGSQGQTASTNFTDANTPPTATGHSETVAPGTSIPLSTLFTFSDRDVGDF